MPVEIKEKLTKLVLVYGRRLLGLSKEEVLFDLIKEELPAAAFLEPGEHKKKRGIVEIR